jgi:hypothetical protein
MREGADNYMCIPFNGKVLSATLKDSLMVQVERMKQKMAM